MKKRKAIIPFVALALAGVLLGVLLYYEPIEEGRCRLIRKPADPEDSLIWLARQWITPLNGRPDHVQDAPAGFGQPRYYSIKSGEKAILMAADFSQKRVRLCIDRDGDGVLSEERCLTARISEETPVSKRRQQFGPISLVAPRDGGTADSDVYLNCFRNDPRGLLLPFARFFRTGRLRLAGQMYQVALVDGDYDGVFHSPLSLPSDRYWGRPGCDVFAIDLNHNGTFESALYGRSEIMPLSRLLRIEDTYYAIDIDPDGKHLSLSQTEPQFGTLAIDVNDADVELRLYSDAADQYLRGRQWQLPAGTYKGIHAVLAKADGSGEIWLSVSIFPGPSASLGPLADFTIRPGQTTSIEIGPPFTVKADVEIRPGRVSIEPVIVGRSGEEYSGDVPRGRPRPSRAFRIIAEDGTVLAQDKFGYT